MTEAADRFVRGAGEFFDDWRVEMATHAVVLRSPHAHARIASITVSAALARSGVLAIFTGRDIAGPHWLIKETRATYRCL